jgi:nitroreductase
MRKKFLAALVTKNQDWAKSAPVLLFLAAAKHFAENDQENRHAAFDAGAAWFAFTMQARFLGLYTHAMAGFDREKAFALLRLDPEKYDILAAIAVGKLDAPYKLPLAFQDAEKPNARKPLSEIYHEMS